MSRSAGLLLFSTLRSSAPAGPACLLRTQEDVRRCDGLMGHPPSDQVLILEIGTGEQNDPHAIDELSRFASMCRTEHHRRFASIGIVGDAMALEPEQVTWLRADATWPGWASEDAATRAISSLQERANARLAARAERERYHRLCHRLRIGLYMATFEGDTFLWVDDEAAHIFGFDSRLALLRSGERPAGRIPEWQPLVGQLEKRPEQIASTSFTGPHGERLRVLLALDTGPRGEPMISGFVHDFGPLLDEPFVQQRVTDVLDRFGYAFFSSSLEGKPLVLSRNDRELLEIADENVHSSASRVTWWADHAARDAWLSSLREKKLLVDYPVLAKTATGRLRWIDVHSRLVDAVDGVAPRIEGFYRDATRRQFEARMARAFSMVGASDAGAQRTADDICHAAAFLFETDACALLFRDPAASCVFPSHVWVSTDRAPASVSPGSGKHAQQTVLFDEKTLPWKADLGGGLFHIESAGFPQAGELFGDIAENPFAFLVLPLLPGDVDDLVPSTPSAISCKAYLWLPLSHPLSFSPGEFSGEIEPFLRLCSRQLEQAGNRDAFDLVHKIVEWSRTTMGLEELARTLDDARRAFQERMAMEGCSVFHVGIEDQRTTLRLATTSGLAGSQEASYALGEGLTGRIAQANDIFVTHNKTVEPGYRGSHVERTKHPGRTWMGIPMRDREGRSLGVIRCVNRTFGPNGASVTGFSFVDVRVAREFAAACSLLTELALLQEERTRMLDRVVHEIRTPSVGIRNNVRFLLRAYTPKEPKVSAKLEDLDLDTTILLNLLQQVDVLRGRRKALLSENASRTSIKDVVRKTLYQLIPEIRARGINTDQVFFDIHGIPDLLLPKAAFAQVIFNLFINALKYSYKEPEKFRLVIQSEVAADVYRVHFKDWGIGVEESYRHQIFQEGFRTPAARRHDARGLGLGLPLCRATTQALGGDVTLEMLRDPTDFVIALPRTLAIKLQGTP